MIVMQGLSKYYGPVPALVDLHLHIRPGEIFGFVGPNGAGKTTTMRILATLLHPSNGRALIDGKDVVREGPAIRRIVGYMPDFMGVYDDLKVFEYLEFFAAAFSISRDKRKSIIDGVLELTDLAGKRGALVDSLSRGMQQRLQLARVLIHDPKVLILDEPASGLDPRARIEIRELLSELRNMGKTIMISSHILSELEKLCDHIGIIEQGQLVFAGTRPELLRRLGVHGRIRVKLSGNGEVHDKAAEHIHAAPGVEGVECVDGALIVKLSEGAEAEKLRAGALAALLVKAGFGITEIAAEDIRLDDAFLQLTRGLVH